MKIGIFLTILLIVYALIVGPFSRSVTFRPAAVKLGYTPDAAVIRGAVGDLRYLSAQMTVTRVLFYFGTLVENFKNKIILKPEYFNMYKTLETAVRLDPYNMDAYYFAQATFTWEINRIQDVNALLKYGMKYRTWDYQLPFFVAFNAAYFQKDYLTAANFMAKAAQLSKKQLHANLTARYFHDSGRTNLGILFLDSIIRNEKDEKVKKIYLIRQEALLAVKQIEDALSSYHKVHGYLPQDVSSLIKEGFLNQIPKDPYGGRFYVDGTGNVKSTSKFSFTIK